MGAGHAHLHVAANVRSLLKRGVRVVLIDPGEFWYSGLATGMLSGMYSAADDQIDPKALVEAGGAEFIRDRVIEVDGGAQFVRLHGGGSLKFDYLSINVGSEVNLDAISGLRGDTRVWPVKPVSNLWYLRQHMEARLSRGEHLTIGVIGGGATGCEVAANLAALCSQYQTETKISLFVRGNRLVKQASAGVARCLQNNLLRRGIAVHFQTDIVRREGDMLIAVDKRKFTSEIVVLASGLQANSLVHSLDLPADKNGGLYINAALHSVENPRVFAAGDCAFMQGLNLPKLGVFGVRQAEFILANLIASIRQQPMQQYQPQKRYLAILNLGDGTALASWGPFWWHGRFSLWLKDFIDRRFMRRFRNIYKK